MNLLRGGKISSLIICFMCLFGCNGGEKSVEMGPVETVEAFYKAISIGQWNDAMALCDTLTMKEYIDNHIEAWTRLQKKDENAMNIAKSIFENMTVTVDDMHKDDNKRVVIYTVEADGLSKNKRAIVTKVERAWRVESITDVN